MVALLKERAVVEGLRNIVAEVGVAEDRIFCEACADIVFFGIVLHDFNDPDKVLLNVGKMLKPVGRLVDLDWKKEPMQLGPPLDVRFSEEQAIGLIRGDGFQIDSVDDSGLYHYLVVATHRQVDLVKDLIFGALLLSISHRAIDPPTRCEETMSLVIEEDAGNWKQEVLDSNLLTAVDFWRLGCSWCDRLSPVLDQVVVAVQRKNKIRQVECAGESREQADSSTIRGHGHANRHLLL